MSSEKIWNQFQNSIFSFVEDSTKGNLIIVARAGTGKSTTILEAGKRINEVNPSASILYSVFNNANSKELNSKIKEKGIKNANAQTFHSLGFAALKSEREYVLVENNKVYKTLKEMPRNLQSKIWPFYSKVNRLISFQRNLLINDLDSLASVAEAFNLWYPKEAGPRDMADMAMSIIHNLDGNDDVINYDEMIYLPARAGMFAKKYDIIFIDEAQDLNPAQNAIIMACVHENSRVIAVGDDRQAIYGWRGANSDSMNLLQNKLNAQILSLPITYRCGKKIVEKAKLLVPDYAFAEANCEGNIEDIDMSLMLSNKALSSIVCSLIKNNKPFVILGKDIGAAILALVKKSKASSLVSLLRFIESEKSRWINAIEDKDPDKLGKLLDELSSYGELVNQFIEENLSIEDFNTRISYLFGDEFEGIPVGKIILSTVHKIKGKESKSVFIINNTFKTSSKEEENIFYVAITRAIENLYVVS